MDARAWVGINLGRSVRSPRAYNIWVPSANRTFFTSDVYFDELLFPWLDISKSTEAIAQRCDGDHAQPPGLPQPGAEASDAAFHTARPLKHDITDHASPSRRVLLLFSGPFSRADGIFAFLSRYGIPSDCIDSENKLGGGREHDILINAVYERLLQRCADGYYAAVVVSPPCSTFSVSRLYQCPDATDGGPPPVRDRNNVMGLSNIPFCSPTRVGTS
eukprot:6173840-Pleurochrysis_carterae.AAC.2